MQKNNDAFCELIKLAVDHAPTSDARAKVQVLLDQHCSGGTVQNDSGGTTPPGK
jgi:hypothetical protein